MDGVRAGQGHLDRCPSTAHGLSHAVAAGWRATRNTAGPLVPQPTRDHTDGLASLRAEKVMELPKRRVSTNCRYSIQGLDQNNGPQRRRMSGKKATLLTVFFTFWIPWSIF